VAAVGGTIVAGYRIVTTAMLPVPAVMTRKKDIERTQNPVSPDDIGFVSLPVKLVTRLPFVTARRSRRGSRMEYNWWRRSRDIPGPLETLELLMEDAGDLERP
jgi:hypothetical protein